MSSAPRTSVQYIQISETQTTPYISMKARRADAGEVHQRAEHDRQHEAAHAAGQADDAGNDADVGG